MNLNTNNAQTIVDHNVYCPYCKSTDAFLISDVTDQSTKLQIPDYGLKYWLCVIFTFGVYMLVRGFPMLEKKRTYSYATYGFCSHCGKSYSAGVPAAAIRSEAQNDTLYLSRYERKIKGLCGGIAEFTELPVKLVRLVMVLYSLSVVPLILYFIFAWILEENPDQ